MFESVTILFKGDELKVPANQVFGLIAEIEEHITLAELHESPKTTAIARAYAAAIRYAGGKATVTEVYELLFDRDSNMNIRNAITSLIMMMVPPDAIRKAQEQEDGEADTKKKQEQASS